MMEDGEVNESARDQAVVPPSISLTVRRIPPGTLPSRSGRVRPEDLVAAMIYEDLTGELEGLTPRLVAEIGSRLARDGAAYGFPITLFLQSDYDPDRPENGLWVDIDGGRTSGFGHNATRGEGPVGLQADIAAWVQDTVFDDMRISSWPECPIHHGYPMSSHVFADEPVPHWVCSLTCPRIPIGSHPGPANH